MTHGIWTQSRGLHLDRNKASISSQTEPDVRGKRDISKLRTSRGREAQRPTYTADVQA